MKKWLSLVVCAVLAACGSTSPVSNGDPVAQVQSALVTCPTPSALATALGSTTQGATLSLDGTDPVQCPQVSMDQTWTGGTLVFSDSPESPTTRGRLYDDPTLAATASGVNNRLFVYHVNNASSGHQRFVVLVKNLGTVAANLTVQQRGVAGPSTAYAYVGKVAVDRWLTSTAGTPVAVQPGAYAELDASFDNTQVAPTYLMNGIWDYSMDQAHEVIICDVNAKDNAINVCPTLPLLSRDVHVRGTFPSADKIYDTAAGVTIDTANGIQALPLASGAPGVDDWAVGTDVTDGSQQTNKGNYGVKYRMHMSLVSSDGQNLAWLYNPRGGSWGGAVFDSAGVFPQSTVLLPPGTGMDGDSTTGVVQNEYSPGTGLTTWVQFMPTGGSAFPLQYVAVPY